MNKPQTFTEAVDNLHKALSKAINDMWAAIPESVKRYVSDGNDEDTTSLSV